MHTGGWCQERQGLWSAYTIIVLVACKVGVVFLLMGLATVIFTFYLFIFCLFIYLFIYFWQANKQKGLLSHWKTQWSMNRWQKSRPWTLTTAGLFNSCPLINDIHGCLLKALLDIMMCCTQICTQVSSRLIPDDSLWDGDWVRSSGLSVFKSNHAPRSM